LLVRQRDGLIAGLALSVVSAGAGVAADAGRLRLGSLLATASIAGGACLPGRLLVAPASRPAPS
jgi:hypothetical protein